MENGRETEAKFYVTSLEKIEKRLISMGARRLQERALELNLRFDTPDGQFQREGRVLRLRQDEAAHLTYKDGSESSGGAVSRRELEFDVSDFDVAQEFIEALGYKVVFIYEKYRTTYELDNAHIMLDETPISHFVEIEGELGKLKPLAEQLGLQWDAAVPASYHALFERVRSARSMQVRDLTFANFENIAVHPGDLGVRAANE